MRLLRIVPDDTKFDFMRFRRVSFPMSAMLSIVAIFLYFHPGLNLGIDFRGGTLIEVQSKSGPADLAKMRATLGTLGLGDVQLQQFGADTDVLIRIAEQPGGDEAQRAAVAKVRDALGDSVEYRRVEVVGPRVSGELLSYGTIGIMFAIGGILLYLWFRFEWQFALGAMIANVHDLVLTVGFMSITRSTSTSPASPRCSPSSAIRSTTPSSSTTASARTCAATSACRCRTCSTARSTRRCRARSSPT